MENRAEDLVRTRYDDDDSTLPTYLELDPIQLSLDSNELRLDALSEDSLQDIESQLFHINLVSHTSLVSSSDRRSVKLGGGRSYNKLYKICPSLARRRRGPHETEEARVHGKRSVHAPVTKSFTLPYLKRPAYHELRCNSLATERGSEVFRRRSLRRPSLIPKHLFSSRSQHDSSVVPGSDHRSSTGSESRSGVHTKHFPVLEPLMPGRYPVQRQKEYSRKIKLLLLQSDARRMFCTLRQTPKGLAGSSSGAGGKGLKKDGKEGAVSGRRRGSSGGAGAVCETCNALRGARDESWGDVLTHYHEHDHTPDFDSDTATSSASTVHAFDSHFSTSMLRGWASLTHDPMFPGLLDSRQHCLHIEERISKEAKVAVKPKVESIIDKRMQALKDYHKVSSVKLAKANQASRQQVHLEAKEEKEPPGGPEKKEAPRSHHDRLLAAVQALYSTQIDEHEEVDPSGVPKTYRHFFRHFRIPLTRENLENFMHDLSVAALESLCQTEPKIMCPHLEQCLPQAPCPLRFSTLKAPDLLRYILFRKSFYEKLGNFSSFVKCLKPWLYMPQGFEFPQTKLQTDGELIQLQEKVNEDGEEMLGIPMDREVKDFQRDYFRRMEEAAIKRKSLRIRKRWLKVYRKAQTVLKIGKSLAKRSKAFELKPQTYVDIGDSVTISVDYGAGRSIDTSEYRRKKEISISAQVTETLTSNPPDRTLLQLEEARRELQKVQVFSEYPLNVQEQILRRAFYITVGPQRVILRQGHIARNFFVIICGEAYVKEHVWDEEREEMVARAAAFIKTGDTFGSHALIHGENRGSSVISRTNMQLLAINGDDYLDLIFRRALSDELPAHIQYLSEMNFMENFPISLLTEKLTVCSMHHFRRNTVITDDSRKCGNLFIIKYGYCKVFRKLHSRERAESEQEVPSFRIINEDTSSDLFQSLLQYQSYIERDSPYVSYVEMPSPAGHTTRLPVTTVPGRKDRIHNQPLRLPDEQRQFVPLMLLREGEVFGLDQTPMCPSRAKSRPTILVSLGAEVIALNKDFYCRHAAKEAKEVAEKTFIYDDVFIRRRLRERVNRDVHLEEVLKHYFLKMAQVKAEIKEQALQEDFL